MRAKPQSRLCIYATSKAACIDVGILPPCFPRPMTSPPSVRCGAIHPGTQPHKTDPPPNKLKFYNPKTPPYLPTSENIQNLKKCLLDQFATTMFNKSRKFPAMSGPPAHIHLKDGAIPKAKHNPISVPCHYREEVKKAPGDNFERGIITLIPIGTSTDWCSTMVITAKKNGKPRRTMDYQHLNSQCKQETHHTSSPLQLSLQVPPNTKKSLRCCGWLPFNPPRWGFTTTYNLHHGVGSFHVPQNALRIISIWWCLYA